VYAVRVVVAAVVAFGLLAPASAAQAPTEPAPSPSAQLAGVSAVGLLHQLAIRPERAHGYRAHAFRGWTHRGSGRCSTRELVLRRDGRPPPGAGARCGSRGPWWSSYDVKRLRRADAVRIDRTVSLRDAWASGARRWTTKSRNRFANDLGYRFSLVTASPRSVRHKGVSDPASWMPRAKGFRCSYAKHFIAVKWRWRLTTDRAERRTLRRTLSRNCSSVQVLAPHRAPIQRPGQRRAVTRTTLSVNPSSGPAHQLVTLSATVARRSGPAPQPGTGDGRVVFHSKASPGGRDTRSRVLGVVALNGRGGRPGTATLVTRRLGAGVLTVRARYRPARHQRFGASVSPPVVVRYTSALGCRSGFVDLAGTPARNSCVDPQAIRVRVPSGPLLLTTRLGNQVRFDVGPRARGTSASRIRASSPRRGVCWLTISDLRAGQLGWSASVSASNLAGGRRVVDVSSVSFGSVTLRRFAGNALGTAAEPVALQSLQALSAAPRQFAAAAVGGSLGSVRVRGVLRMSVAPRTPPGAYAGTITFTLT
jgi:hypothetical protein